uniref:Uncharacterized protein n=1 Tax=Ciona savignyi TaxID=51511 RepID=H2ZKM0_CIOSA
MDLNYDVTATSNHLVPKEQIVPMNGISTNVINSHAWPQTVTLTGAIGALRRNNPDDIMKLHHNQSEVGLTEITRNHNNSNNYDITSDLSPLVDGRSERSAHIDTLQSLLGNSNPPSGLLVETTAPTGNGGSHEQHNFRQIGELLSLLDSGSKETTASQDLNSFSFRDSAIFETSNLTSNS